MRKSKLVFSEKQTKSETVLRRSLITRTISTSVLHYDRQTIEQNWVLTEMNQRILISL